MDARDIVGRRAVLHHLLVVILFFASVGRVEAVFGQLDTDDRFPFVVSITMEYPASVSWCSAVVKGGGLVVGTAAHCVVNKKGERAEKITIEYVDADGVVQSTVAKQYFLPSKLPIHPEASGEWIERNRKWLEYTRSDIALIVPEQRIQTLGYAHWITDLLVTTDDYEKGSGQPAEDSIWQLLSAEANHDHSKIRWSPKTRALLEARYRKHFGDSPQALIVGFGGYCRREPCDPNNSDRRRRFAESPTFPVGFETGDKPPWIWTLGADASGVNPARPGDSGGATFLKALDGRWFFAGYNSNANGASSYSSSLLEHVNLYARVVIEGDFPITDIEQEGIFAYVDKPDSWPRKQAIRFFDEVLEAWSLDVGTASMRLRALYRSVDEYYGDDRSDYFDAYEDKRSLFTKWPERRFERRRNLSPNVDCELAWKSVTCNVTAHVDWKFKSGDVTMYGESEVSLRIQLEGLTQVDLQQGYGPSISGEGGRLLRTSGLASDPTLDQTACRRLTGKWVIVNPADGKELREKFDLKRGPSEDELIVGRIPRNAIGLDVDGCSEKWCRAKYRCLDGWIEKQFVQETRKTLHRVVGVSAKDRNGLNIRAMPHPTSDKIGSIPYNGRDVIVHACGVPNWCFVTHNAISGWVSRRHIELQEASAVP
ncbi:trypsin-like serine protease [Bradyrhizobium sp. IC3123]|uniref:SH3 domain-containing protein n=1 Tax=Bradyrhizobium sp. IC3123 TaxID=2793803 RepID=UPI001CD491E9|nr:SH3 domain-containing protein [Bradyrhizobium sp. IC3123]MCA1392045.1 trypsin-like serine protease [Bradyrhizobium sp. IC3123]